MPIRFSTLVLLFSLWVLPAKGQVTIWSDNFNNGCVSDCIANTWNGWTIQDNVGGTTGGAPNNWFVSCAEEGILPPGCGSTCIGDASLHIGANPGAGGDMGASFNETGLTNATFRRATSPTISTVGYNTLTLQFDFIAFGSAACTDDRAQLWLSTDNGGTWPVGFQYCLNSTCCTGGCNGYDQGLWTLYTLALPAAFNNNPNVRIGFHWRNNGNGSGTDPSVAIDDVRITTVLTPAEILKFQAEEKNQTVRLNWTSAQEVNLSRYEIERGTMVAQLQTIGKVIAKGGAAQTSYSFNDPSPVKEASYYRLKMVDQNGHLSYSNVLKVSPGSKNAVELANFNSMNFTGNLDFTLWAVDDMPVDIELVDVEGKSVLRVPGKMLKSGENNLSLDVSKLASRVYMLHVRSANVPLGFNQVAIVQKFFKAE